MKKESSGFIQSKILIIATMLMVSAFMIILFSNKVSADSEYSLDPNLNNDVKETLYYNIISSYPIEYTNGDTITIVDNGIKRTFEFFFNDFYDENWKTTKEYGYAVSAYWLESYDFGDIEVGKTYKYQYFLYKSDENGKPLDSEGNKVDRVADAQILAFSREFGIKALDDHIETTINSIRYFVYNNEKTARVIEGFDNLKGNIKIPENVTINGKTYKVTIIDANAFSNNNAITSVELPDTIKSIRPNAFSNTGIREIRIPDSVEEIDTYAFGYTGERNEKTGEIIINKVPGFLIYANSKSIASQYAYDNGFTLVSEKVAAKIKVKAKAKRKKNRRVYLKWKTKKYADGYQIYRSKTKKGKYKKVKTLNNNTTNNWTSKKIKKKTKKVFYKVRSFTLIGGKKAYGKWSKVVRVKFK